MTTSAGSGAPEPADLVVRAATPQDRPAVIELCRASLGWKAGDPNEAFFSWKHDDNPFGASPGWVAEAPDGALVGLRVFLRWRFHGPGGEVIEAVRAVDTATHPDWQGKGIFTRLTLGALPQLADRGIDVVFNTPNDQSRPGYLKMGWQPVGRVPVAVRLRSLRSTRRLSGARAAAEKWSRLVGVGLDAARAFADTEATRRLLDRLAAPAGIHTVRTPEYLAWRYRFEPLAYRVMPVGDKVDDGVIVFRVRRRGSATELTVCEVLAPRAAPVRPAVGHLLRATGADYAIGRGGRQMAVAGFVPAPRLGPILVWRPVTRQGVPGRAELSLSLGDVELF